VHHIKTTGLPSHHRQLQYDAESFLILRVRAWPRWARRALDRQPESARSPLGYVDHPRLRFKRFPDYSGWHSIVAPHPASFLIESVPPAWPRYSRGQLSSWPRELERTQSICRAPSDRFFGGSSLTSNST
jgi:hypothetical protein